MELRANLWEPGWLCDVAEAEQSVAYRQPVARQVKGPGAACTRETRLWQRYLSGGMHPALGHIDASLCHIYHAHHCESAAPQCTV
jgi:hypothetical protein